MKDMYSIAGITKQGFHQWLNRDLQLREEQQQLLPILRELREDHPKLSCRQMYGMLKPQTMGRDQFEAFCHGHGLKVPTPKRRFWTTDSRGVNRFPNLLLNLDELSGSNQLWVSDITYFFIGEKVYYLTFIMDIYNREIIGYHASTRLLTSHTTVPALRMAIRQTGLTRQDHVIFHSDGGGQYYSKTFQALTKRYNIQNSMGKTAYENPFAERINGTIKNDYLESYSPKNYKELILFLTKAVKMYNHFRPHKSLGDRSPKKFKRMINEGLLTKKWVINKKKKVSKKEKVNITIK